MLIECPVRTADEAKILLESGADILYGAPAGDFFGNKLQIVSRRPWIDCSIPSLAELKAILHVVKQKKKEFYLAFNEHFYTEQQLRRIVGFLKENRQLKNLIVADLGLILLARKELPNLSLIASVGTHIFNSASLQFYIDQGISEVVLPREISSMELKFFKKNAPQVRFSYIIKNDDCPNIDGLCSYSHGIYDISGACADLFGITCYNKASGTSISVDDYNFRSRQNCKVCNLQEWHEAGLDIVKIAGRGASLQTLCKDLSFIRFCRSIIEKTNSEYIAMVKSKFFEIYEQDCVYCQNMNL